MLNVIFVILIIIVYLVFLLYKNSITKDALQDKEKKERLQKYKTLRYLSISNNHVLDLETLIYRYTGDYDGSSITDVSWLFSDDLTQTCTYTWYEKYGTLRVIDKGIINEDALYKSQFQNPDGTEVDLSRPSAFPLYYKGRKTIDAYIECFKSQHSFKLHEWPQLTIETIKIARKNLNNFYKGQKRE